ncbi:MAG: KTSC domain-containing protein [Bacteroidota bacterium]
MPSSVIAWFFYEKKSAELTISFVSGDRYIYKKVPPAIYTEFSNAFSKGTYFNKEIKGHYEFEKKLAGNSQNNSRSRHRLKY